MIDFNLVAVAVVAVIGIYAIVRQLTIGGSKRAYLDALKIKDGIIDDLRSEVKRWKGKASAYHTLPPGTEEPTDIVRALPAWARPLAQPILQWAQTEEGKQAITKMIEKYTRKDQSIESEGV